MASGKAPSAALGLTLSPSEPEQAGHHEKARRPNLLVGRSEDLVLTTLPLPGCSGESTLESLRLPSAREPRRPIPRLSRRHSLLGSSRPSPYPPDRLLPPGEVAKGYSVPANRLSLSLGRHSSPGGCWGERRRKTSIQRPRVGCRPIPPPCPFGPSHSTGLGWLAVTTIRCLHGRCPCSTVLGGVPGPVPSYCLLSHAPPRRAGQTL
jgi:hypothetical protein